MMMAVRTSICQSNRLILLVLVMAIGTITGCNNYKNLLPNFLQDNRTTSHWRRDGIITLSRAAPSPFIDGLPDHRSTTALGFVPASLYGSPVGSWISIDTATSGLTLMKGDQVVAKLKGEGLAQMKHGLFRIKHKQRNPLWYAPDSYFVDRLLPAPLEGDKARFRRGALGDFVIFLDQETPIHSGPLWLSEIGGVKMEDADISKLYYSLEVGAAVEVK